MDVSRKELLTIREVASVLGISIPRVWRLVARYGVLPAYRVGRRWLIPRPALKRWLETPGRDGEAEAR